MDDWLIYYPNIFFMLLLCFLPLCFICCYYIGVIVFRFLVNIEEMFCALLRRYGFFSKKREWSVRSLMSAWIRKAIQTSRKIDKAIERMSRLVLGICFILILCVTQYIITSLVPPNIPPPAANFNLMQQKSRVDVVYFVDSTNDTADPDDTDGSPISVFLGRLLPKRNIGVMGQPAAQPDVYAAYASYVARRYRPTYVIVEINIRALSPVWDNEPSYQFEEQKRYFRLFADTPLMIFWPAFVDNQFFGPLNLPVNTMKHLPFFNMLEKYGLMKHQEVQGIYRSSGDAIRDEIFRNYMYRLTEDNRKVQSLLEIADIFDSNSTKLIYYFTPIDYQSKMSYIGETYNLQLTNNVDLLKALLFKKHAIVVDLSQKLTSEAFTWRSIRKADTKAEAQYINEHLNEFGRRFVAESLANEMK